MMNRKGRRRFLIGLPLAVVAVIAGWFLVKYLHVPCFAVVRPGQLYRSGQPRDRLDWLRLKRRFGIRSVVLLRPWDENGGGWKEGELAATRKAGMRLLHLPMDDTAVPTVAQADAFLAWARDSDNWPVLVHCKAGKDRTGTLCALYRVQVQGWRVEDALGELRRIDDGDPLNEGVEQFLRTYHRSSREAPVGG